MAGGSATPLGDALGKLSNTDLRTTLRVLETAQKRDRPELFLNRLENAGVPADTVDELRAQIDGGEVSFADLEIMQENGKPVIAFVPQAEAPAPAPEANAPAAPEIAGVPAGMVAGVDISIAPVATDVAVGTPPAPALMSEMQLEAAIEEALGGNIDVTVEVKGGQTVITTPDLRNMSAARLSDDLGVQVNSSRGMVANGQAQFVVATEALSTSMQSLAANPQEELVATVEGTPLQQFDQAVKLHVQMGGRSTDLMLTYDNQIKNLATGEMITLEKLQAQAAEREGVETAQPTLSETSRANAPIEIAEPPLAETSKANAPIEITEPPKNQYTDHVKGALGEGVMVDTNGTTQVYLNNTGDLTREDIAEKLGIDEINVGQDRSGNIIVAAKALDAAMEGKQAGVAQEAPAPAQQEAPAAEAKPMDVTIKKGMSMDEIAEAIGKADDGVYSEAEKQAYQNAKQEIGTIGEGREALGAFRKMASAVAKADNNGVEAEKHQTQEVRNAMQSLRASGVIDALKKSGIVEANKQGAVDVEAGTEVAAQQVGGQQQEREAGMAVG